MEEWWSSSLDFVKNVSKEKEEVVGQNGVMSNDMDIG